MCEYKVVVLGGMGSGKLMLVCSIVVGVVVDIDVVNSDCFGVDKVFIIVVLDYVDIDLFNGECLCFYGMFGQQCFDFLWLILLQGVWGGVLLLDVCCVGLVSELQDYLQVLQLFVLFLVLVVVVIYFDQVLQVVLDDWVS